MRSGPSRSRIASRSGPSASSRTIPSAARRSARTAERKLRPRTAAVRTRRRETGGSRSSSTFIAPSRESGSAPAKPVSRPTRSSSLRKSGLPPARSMMASISWGHRGAASVATWASARLSVLLMGARCRTAPATRSEARRLVTAGHKHEPRTVLGGSDEMSQDLGAGLVEPMRVLDDDHAGTRKHRVEQRRECSGPAFCSVVGIDRGGLRCRRHVDRGDFAEQRQHRQQLRARCG